MSQNYKGPRKIGKHGKLWLKTRAKWFKMFPSEYYNCYLCKRSLLKYQVTLDHIQSRSRHPELRYEMSNLAPCCMKCNKAKGSMDLEEYNKRMTLNEYKQGV